MKAIAFSNLIHDMKLHKIEKEHYSFIYNHFIFDVILSYFHLLYKTKILFNSTNILLRIDFCLQNIPHSEILDDNIHASLEFLNLLQILYFYP